MMMNKYIKYNIFIIYLICYVQYNTQYPPCPPGIYSLFGSNLIISSILNIVIAASVANLMNLMQ